MKNKTSKILATLMAVTLITAVTASWMKDKKTEEDRCNDPSTIALLTQELRPQGRLDSYTPYDVMLNGAITAKKFEEERTMCTARLYLRVNYNRTEPKYARAMARPFMLRNGFKEGRTDVYYTEVFESYLIKKDGTYGGIVQHTLVKDLSPKFKIPKKWVSLFDNKPRP